MSIHCVDANKETSVLRNNQVSEMQKRLKRAISSGGVTPPPTDPLTPIQKLEALLKEMPNTGYIRQAGLLKIFPFSPATLWRWVKDGTFPQPIKLSPRITAWRVEAVVKWLQSIS